MGTMTRMEIVDEVRGVGDIERSAVSGRLRVPFPVSLMRFENQLLQNRLGLQALGASDAIATEPLGTCAPVFAPARDVAVRSRIDAAAAP